MRSDPHPDLPTSELTPDGRRRELAAIFARGLLRLRDRAGLATEPTSSNPCEAANSTLEAVPDKSLTVHAG